ncbi:MAG: sialidase family protein [Dehalococcoidia bacterium]
MRYGLAVILSLVFLAVFLSASQATVAPTALNSNAATDVGDDTLPRLATDGAGTWVAVWRSTDDLGGTIGTDSDILVAWSSDGGATWTSPAALNSNAGTDVGNDDGPDVATDNLGNWVVVWSSSEDLDGTMGTDFDIFVARSTDGGATWTAPAVLNSNAGSDCCEISPGYDSPPTIITDGAGNWVVAWHSNGDGGTTSNDIEIRTARSTNNGATWTPVAFLNIATEPGFIDCCDDSTPSMATSNGVWVAAWLTSPIGHGDDIFVARSTDAGATWTDQINLTNNDGAGAPPRLASDGAGNWVIVWMSDGDIHFVRSVDNGVTWTAEALLNNNAANDPTLDRLPRVATDGGGNWVTVWQSAGSLGGTIGSDLDILIARSSDGGATWTYPEPLHGNAATDSGSDTNAGVKYGDGRWIAFWQSNESLGGTIGTDYDILYLNCLPAPSQWSIPPGDGDCDGYDTPQEATMGTHPGNACGFTPGGDTASENWPPDLVESNNVNIQDVLVLKPMFGGSAPARYDIVASGGTIDISDVLALKPFFGLSCTP